MIRASIVSLSALTSLASASTVNFVTQDVAVGRLAGVNTSAFLSADETTFTITLRNQSDTGSMTGFYIESGSALAGLGEATINNGSGVGFSPPATAGDASGVSVIAGQAGVTPNAGTTVFGNASGSQISGATGPFGAGWSGSFFSMIGRGDLGQSNGEFVSVTFAHDGSFSLDSLIQSLANDDLRFIQSYDYYGDQSASGFLTSVVVVVPLPPAAWAGLGMLGVVAGARAVKKHRKG